MFDIIAYRRAQRPGGLAATNPGGNRAGIPGTGQSTQHHERRLSLADRRTFPRADVHQSAAARLQNVISSSAAPRLPGVISLHSNVNITHGLDACSCVCCHMAHDGPCWPMLKQVLLHASSRPMLKQVEHQLFPSHAKTG